MLGLREREEIKIQAVPGGIDFENGVAQVSIGGPAECHLEGRESFSTRSVLSFLAQLHECLPRPIGVLSIAIVAHFPFDLKQNRDSLLDGYFVEIGSHR